MSELRAATQHKLCDAQLLAHRGSPPFQGAKHFTIYLPCPVSNMEVLSESMRNIKALIVGLENGEIRVYSDQSMISCTQTNVRCCDV